MSTKHKRRATTNVSLAEAVETLSHIAQLEVDGEGVPREREEGFAETESQLSTNKRDYKILWLQEVQEGGDGTSVIAHVRGIFRTVLNYLKQFYTEQQGGAHDENASKGVHTIMVLVGDAADRLEKYTKLFTDTKGGISLPVSQLPEYRQLQHFYRTKLAPRLDEGKLGLWILALSQQALKHKAPLRLKHNADTMANRHVFIDLDSVKKDMDYELFFMRKEDGTRFFSPRLIRNIKLVSGVGSYFPASRQLDPLVRVDTWLDSFVQKTASDMVAHLRPRLDAFFHEALRHKGKELVEELSKAIMALLLSASPSHLTSRHRGKSCLAYFRDFQNFLREVLNSRAYQKLIIYPPQNTNKLACCLHDTVLALCRSLYLYGQGLQVMRPVIREFANEEEVERKESSTPLTDALAASYSALQHQLRQYAHGPLAKVIQLVSEGSSSVFDPLVQLNLPTQMYALYIEKHRILYTRMASPVVQEYIHKAAISEEFKGFLLSCGQGHTVKKHLSIVLQDYTSWRESARCHTLEALHHHRDYGKYFDVAVLAINNDFYLQAAPYHQDHHADIFKHHLIEHLCDEQTGFWFPVTMRTTLFRSFFPPLLEAIHTLFFHHKNALSREARMAFIDLCYLFTFWKLIEMSGASAFSLLCKDGIDIGASYGAALFYLCNLLMGSKVNGDVIDYLKVQTLAPALLWRERAMLPESFQRLVIVLRTLEGSYRSFGDKGFRGEVQKLIGSLYDWQWFRGEISWPTAPVMP